MKNDLNSYTFYTSISSYTKMNVCIKGVKPENWKYLKSEAVKTNKKIGEYINFLVMKEREKPKNNWETISSWRPTLTEKEAEEMLNGIEEAFNRETEFR